MKKTWLLAALAALCAGCAVGNPARIEADYTTSYNLALAGQTLHPEAALNTRPVTGMLAPEASKVYERYLKGLERPAETEQGYIIPLAAQGGTFK